MTDDYSVTLKHFGLTVNNAYVFRYAIHTQGSLLLGYQFISRDQLIDTIFVLQ